MSKQIADDLNQLGVDANREVNKTLLIWGAFGAVCAIAIFWLL